MQLIVAFDMNDRLFRAKAIKAEQIEEEKQVMLNDAGTELIFEVMTGEEFETWTESQLRPPQPITAEQRLANAEEAINDLIMTIMMGGM